MARKVEDQEHWAPDPQLLMPKVGDWNLSAFGLQVLVLKVETQDSFAIHIFLEFYFFS